MPNILCAGIATLDQIFRLDAMPSRAEKYRATDLAVTGGGTAANAAVAMARLGARVGLFATLGDDPIGHQIREGLSREGVDTDGLRLLPGHRSPLSAILVDGAGERMIISHADPALPRDTDWLPSTLPAGIDGVLGDTRWQEGSAHLFRLARAAGKPAVLDGDRAPTVVPGLVDLATHVAFSLQGLRDLTGEGDARRALRAFGPRPGTWIAVTNGDEGVFWWRDGEIAHRPAFRVPVVDTLGAGDTWHGAFTVRLAEGADEAEAIRFASAAAALKCTRFGGRDGAPGRTEVETFLAHAE
ncbi:PfkB family carbohydrate kinase [Salinarimonas soli]|uniref:Sugar kinase n=1 Tax=Salinarimonas soli TaxID=1638099 RepID=A0A5B2VR77_9HYPH|nr:PfkB family carbohydrate kinase [Salinarimonas soli]KAA2242283.1 sugar kinase [Salinarimonas soli]